VPAVRTTVRVILFVARSTRSIECRLGSASHAPVASAATSLGDPYGEFAGSSTTIVAPTLPLARSTRATLPVSESAYQIEPPASEENSGHMGRAMLGPTSAARVEASPAEVVGGSEPVVRDGETPLLGAADGELAGVELQPTNNATGTTINTTSLPTVTTSSSLTESLGPLMAALSTRTSWGIRRMKCPEVDQSVRVSRRGIEVADGWLSNFVKLRGHAGSTDEWLTTCDDVLSLGASAATEAACWSGAW